MKTIPLTQGRVTVVDDADFDSVSQFKWYAQKSKSGGVRAARAVRKPNGKRTKQYLHQFLMPEVKRIDHRNGDELDNQRQNLRPATNKQNARGFQRKRAGTSSRYRGVSKFTYRKSWQAQIRVDGKLIRLGSFNAEIDAARAYDKAALEHFGEYASLNLTSTPV